jgi:hypothetical protein
MSRICGRNCAMQMRGRCRADCCQIAVACSAFKSKQRQRGGIRLAAAFLPAVRRLAGGLAGFSDLGLLTDHLARQNGRVSTAEPAQCGRQQPLRCSRWAKEVCLSPMLKEPFTPLLLVQ